MEFKYTINVLFASGQYTLISYIKGGSLEWNVARNYNADDKTWSSGNYCYSLESALAVFLEKMDSRFVKSDYQIEVEKKYPDLGYARMVELSTQFKDRLIEDDRESAMDYFDETCEMSGGERIFFGLKDEKTLEAVLEEPLEEHEMMMHIRRGR